MIINLIFGISIYLIITLPFSGWIMEMIRQSMKEEKSIQIIHVLAFLLYFPGFLLFSISKSILFFPIKILEKRIKKQEANYNGQF